jgi:hypothetical protein
VGVEDFMQQYGGRRLDGYSPPPPLWDEPDGENEPDEEADLDYEFPAADWEAVDPALPFGWHAREWEEGPVRYVDGKDVGETVAWLKAPGGYPAPIRLSQIGGVVVRLVDGECRREIEIVDRVVSMVADLFPWEEVESFAADLQAHGFRLLPAQAPENKPSYDFEKMRKAAQNRSNDEMGVLEEAVLASAPGAPAVVDGRLEPRSGGFSSTEPVFGVIKTQRRYYLHPLGMQLLYELAPGQRTPVFALPSAKLPVVSWFVRLAGGGGTMPNWGIVRVEAPKSWFEQVRGQDFGFVDRLTRLVWEYRCRDRSYGRVDVSLHPVVRAEEKLGALFVPNSLLTSRFYRLGHLLSGRSHP